MGSPPVRPTLVAYLDKHIGETVIVGSMAKELDLTIKQIQSGMKNLLNTNNGVARGIEIIANGQVWVYRGPQDDKTDLKDMLFEYLATTKSGKILVQDGNGGVYQLSELE